MRFFYFRVRDVFYTGDKAWGLRYCKLGFTMPGKRGRKGKPEKRMRNVANFTALPRAGVIAKV